ncbi:MAG: hypothetical protein ACKPE3_33775, partial [Sphaerospermopsis kisseleviana]
SEHWIIPNKDCTFDEVRGIKNPDDIVLKLQEQITRLNLENSQLSFDITQYQKQIKELEESKKSANQETNTEVVEPANINTSFDILSRFA